MATYKTLEDAVDYMQALMRDIDGMREAPNKPPAKIGSYPFCTAFPALGTVQIGNPQGGYVIKNVVALELHVARKDLTNDVGRAYPFLEKIVRKLAADVALGFEADAINGDIQYTFGEMFWFGKETIGWRFNVPVKIIGEV